MTDKQFIEFLVTEAQRRVSQRPFLGDAMVWQEVKGLAEEHLKGEVYRG